MKSFSENKDLGIQKADKYNTVAIIDKNASKDKVKHVISDSTKFEILNIKEDKELMFILDSA